MKKLPIVTALLFAFAASTAANAERVHARLDGVQENPSISTTARGRFDAVIESIHGEPQIRYTLEYTAMEGGAVTQAHIHVARDRVNGGISAWLCGGPTLPGPEGTPVCPQPAPGETGEVSGTITRATVIGPGPQLIAPGQIEELIRMIRAGAAYANVHSTAAPGGEIRGQIGDGRGQGDHRGGGQHHHDD